VRAVYCNPVAAHRNAKSMSQQARGGVRGAQLATCTWRAREEETRYVGNTGSLGLLHSAETAETAPPRSHALM